MKGNEKALKAINTISAALNSYCTALPQNVDSAIVTLTKAVADGQAVLKGS